MGWVSLRQIQITYNKMEPGIMDPKVTVSSSPPGP